MKKYRISRTPNLTTPHNKATWKKIKSELEKHIMADYDTLVSLSVNHNHPAGGKAFVDYCIRNGWLPEVKD